MADKRIVDLTALLDADQNNADIYEMSDGVAAQPSKKETRSQMINRTLGISGGQANLPGGVTWSINSLSQRLNNNRTSPAVNVPFNTSRQPNLTHDTEISFFVGFTNAISQSGSATLQISPDNTTWQTVGAVQSVIVSNSLTLYLNKIIQAGYWYRIINSGTGIMAISPITELTL
jgi:hypothetical protein